MLFLCSVKPEDDVFEDDPTRVPVKTDDLAPMPVKSDNTVKTDIALVAPKVEGANGDGANSSGDPDAGKDKVARPTHKHYLVKWRALSYEESTWELEEDVDPLKVEHFLRFKDPPPKEKWKVRTASRDAKLAVFVPMLPL